MTCAHMPTLCHTAEAWLAACLCFASLSVEHSRGNYAQILDQYLVLIGRQDDAHVAQVDVDSSQVSTAQRRALHKNTTG